VSVEAFQRRSSSPQLLAVTVRPVGTDGGVESGQAGVVSVALLLLADSLPALSIAVTVYE
jgi:hypothetical protein